MGQRGKYEDSGDMEVLLYLLVSYCVKLRS